MSSPRSHIIDFIEQGAIPAEKINDALIVAKIAPDGKSWRTFIDHLLLWLGALALAFAAMFFIAYNWSDIGHFSKFALVEGLIVLAIGAYCRFAEQTSASKVALLVATISLGVLLALYGQTYQTGADPWQLFFNWALLMVPWALIGRFPALWIVWVVLINTSIVLYHQTFRGALWLMVDSDTTMLWLLFLINTLVLAAWEFLAARWHWLSERWALRLLAIGSGLPMTWLVLEAIFDRSPDTNLSGLVWAAWLAVLSVIYRKIRPDLFMLAGGCLSGITVAVAFLSKHLLKNGSSGSFLILSLLVICMGTAAAYWLKNVHQEFSHE